MARTGIAYPVGRKHRLRRWGRPVGLRPTLDADARGDRRGTNPGPVGIAL